MRRRSPSGGRPPGARALKRFAINTNRGEGRAMARDAACCRPEMVEANRCASRPKTHPPETQLAKQHALPAETLDSRADGCVVSAACRNRPPIGSVGCREDPDFTVFMAAPATEKPAQSGRKRLKKSLARRFGRARPHLKRPLDGSHVRCNYRSDLMVHLPRSTDHLLSMGNLPERVVLAFARTRPGPARGSSPPGPRGWKNASATVVGLARGFRLARL